jgi:hypothetical protein
MFKCLIFLDGNISFSDKISLTDYQNNNVIPQYLFINISSNHRNLFFL